ncbi:MAG TPA: hypothetical protein VIX59_00920, partial [Candidatus Binataceae bacterium]
MAELRIEISDERIPGAAPVSPHSQFGAVADARPADASVITRPIFADTSYAAIAPNIVSLCGEWRRRAMPEDPPVAPLGPGFDDSDWDRVMVPDNYGLEPALAAHFGPVFYRCRLAPLDAPRCVLEFDAVDYLADVWLDDRHLGRHEGYFAPFAFNVTHLVRLGSVLTVRVQDPFEDWEPDKPFFLHAKRAIKGTLKYHDSRPGGLPGVSTPGWTPRIAQSMTTGGITGSVRLHGTGAARVDAIFITPIDAADGLIQLAFVISNSGEDEIDALLGFSIADPDGVEPRDGWLKVRLRPGANRIDARVRILNPRLWWPASHRDLG